MVNLFLISMHAGVKTGAWQDGICDWTTQWVPTSTFLMHRGMHWCGDL
jgi:hypothetical protein